MKLLEEYVKGLMETAFDDRTSPVFDPKQGRFSGWRTDELLLQIEADVLRGQKDPQRFSVICWFVRRELEDSQGAEPAALVILALGELNGKRRLTPVTAELEKLVSDLIDKIRGKIENLPTDTRRQRCQQFLLYQHGIFLDACGRFDEAAAVQEQAAQLADELGDHAAAGISRFVALTHLAKHAFCLGQGEGEAVEQVIASVPALQKAVANSALAVQWGIGNAYTHILGELIWHNPCLPSTERQDEKIFWWHRIWILLSDQKSLLGPQFDDYIELVDASKFEFLEEAQDLSSAPDTHWGASVDFLTRLWEEDYEDEEDEEDYEDEESEAVARLAKLIGSKSPEVSATALLVLGRLAAARRDNEQSGHYYRQISRAGAVRHISAIAERELAKLGGRKRR